LNKRSTLDKHLITQEMASLLLGW